MRNEIKRKERFSIRKFNNGVGSVKIGAAIFLAPVAIALFGGSDVSANNSDVASTENVVATTSTDVTDVETVNNVEPTTNEMSETPTVIENDATNVALIQKNQISSETKSINESTVMEEAPSVETIQVNDVVDEVTANNEVVVSSETVPHDVNNIYNTGRENYFTIKKDKYKTEIGVADTELSRVVMPKIYEYELDLTKEQGYREVIEEAEQAVIRKVRKFTKDGATYTSADVIEVAKEGKLGKVLVGIKPKTQTGYEYVVYSDIGRTETAREVGVITSEEIRTDENGKQYLVLYMNTVAYNPDETNIHRLDKTKYTKVVRDDTLEVGQYRLTDSNGNEVKLGSRGNGSVNYQMFDKDDKNTRVESVSALDATKITSNKILRYAYALDLSRIVPNMNNYDDLLNRYLKFQYTGIYADFAKQKDSLTDDSLKIAEYNNYMKTDAEKTLEELAQDQVWNEDVEQQDLVLHVGTKTKVEIVGNKEITTTYTVNPNTGEVTPTVTERLINNWQDVETKITYSNGQANLPTREEIINLVQQVNPNASNITPFVDGSTDIQTKVEVTDADGNTSIVNVNYTIDDVTENVTDQATIEYRENKQLKEWEVKVVRATGTDGSKTVTKSYTKDDATGKFIETVTETNVVPKVNGLIEYRPADEETTRTISNGTIYRKNPDIDEYQTRISAYGAPGVEIRRVESYDFIQDGENSRFENITYYHPENEPRKADGYYVQTKPRPMIIEVGTPKDEYEILKMIDMEIIYQPNDTLEVGMTNVIQEGNHSQATRAKIWSVDEEFGDIRGFETYIDPIDMTPRIIDVGTKPKIERTATDLPTQYVTDDTLPAGTREVVQQGRPHTEETTTTYTMDPKTGVVTENTQTTATIDEGLPTIIKVGTKQTTEVTDQTDPVIVYEADPTIPTGERIEIPGVEGRTEITTDYTVDPNTGVVTENKVEKRIDGRPTVIKVGTKPKVERTEENLPTVYEADETKEFGTREEIAGSPKITEKTTTYTVDPNNGSVTENTPTTNIVDEGRPTVVKVGAKPKVEQSTNSYQTIGDEDDTLEVGNIVTTQEGSDGVIETTTTYTVNPQTGDVIEHTNTIEVTPTIDKLISYGMKPKVERVEEDLPVKYEFDENIPANSREEITGRPKITEKTITATLDSNGYVVNDPEIVVIDEGVPTVIKVGIKPKVERTEEDLPKVYESNPDLEVGQTEEVPGKPKVTETTTTYTTNEQTGEITENTPVTQIIDNGRPTVVKVGTKPKVETKETDLGITYVDNPYMDLGTQQVITEGEPKVEKITTTYTVDENGNVVPNTPTTEVITRGTQKVIEVGAKSKVEHTEEELPTVYEEDSNLTGGETQVIQGEPKVTSTFTNYVVNPVTGKVTEQPPITRVTDAGVPTVVKVGTKPKVEITNEDLPIRYIPDETLDVGQTAVEENGEPKVTETTTTYKVDTNTGEVTPNEPTTTVTSQGKPQVIKVGTKPKVEITNEDLPTTYEEDNTKEVGTTETIDGNPKVTKTTTTYTVDENGKAIPNEPVTTITDNGTPTVIKVGTKPKVEITNEDLPTVYVGDDDLPYGEQITEDGRPKVTETTTTYGIDENGNVVPKETTTVVTDNGLAKVIKVGTKPKVEVTNEDLPKEYASDPNLEVGQTNEITGRPKVTETTTTYTVDPNTGEVTPTEATTVTDNGTPTVVKVGAKPKVEITNENLPPVYEKDDDKEVGVVETIDGTPKVTEIITTYDVDDKGNVVPNEPTTTITDNGTPSVIKVGTKPKVEVTNEDLPPIYEKDDTKEIGVVEENDGKPKVIETTTTYDIDDKGNVVPNEPTEKIVDNGQPKVITVGTKPKVEITNEDLPTKYVPNDSLEVGNTETVDGKPKVTETVTTYDIDDKGNVIPNEPTSSVIDEGTPTVVQIGTKPKVEVINEELPPVYEKDDSIEVGDTDEVQGKPKVTETTTTYTVDDKGNVTPNEPTSLVIDEGTPTVIKVGTKPKAELTEEELPPTYVGDNNGNTGEEQGKPKVIETTTTYDVDDKGNIIPNEPTTKVVDNGTPTIIKVDSKPKVERTEEELPKEYVPDFEMDYGTTKEIPGTPKVTETTTTYTVNPKTGEKTPNEPTITVVDNGTPTVVKVGAKPKVERTEEDLPTIYEKDDTLEFGKTTEENGSPKVTETTIVYEVDPNTGVVTPTSSTTVTDEGRPTVIKVGTKPKVEVTHEGLPPVYTKDDSEDAGEIIENGGRPKVIETTTTYEIDDKGNVIPKEPTSSVIDPGQPKVITIGTKPKVEISHESVPIKYVPNDEIEVGKVEITDGKPKVTETVTTYEIDDKGNVVPNEPTSTVTDEGTPTIIKVGTKPKTEIINEDLPPVYVGDDNGGSETTPGTPKVTERTTTYGIDDKGNVVPNEPTTTIISEGTPTIIKVDTTPQVERVSDDPQVTYVPDESIPYGERTEVPGTPKVVEITTTYTVDPKTGDKTPNEPTSTIVEVGTPTIVKIGTKPSTERTEEDLPVIYKGDDTLEFGETVTEEEGSPKVTEVTTTYIVDPNTGVVTINTNGRVTDGKSKVVKIGTKSKVTTKEVPNNEIDPQTLKPNQKIEKGRVGTIEVTTTYEVDPNTGVIAEKVKERVVQEPIDDKIIDLEDNTPGHKDDKQNNKPNKDTSKPQADNDQPVQNTNIQPSQSIKRLPNTGDEENSAAVAVGAIGLAGLAMLARRRKND